MCFLKPILDFENETITIVNTQSQDSLKLNIDMKPYQTKTIGKFTAIDEKLVVKFLQNLLDVPCTIAKSTSQSSMHNKSALLLTNLTSLLELTSDMSLIERFRSNIVVKTQNSFEEDEWHLLKSKSTDAVFEKLCDCDRCHMITITNKGGVDPSLFLGLSKKRKVGGKVYFGINMNIAGLGNGFIETGEVFIS
ncbi:unnamed protein product [Ambrosiozyma monospora]|uniref:Unnamed protein product n=1 Tax=Ambrosiozyma monospora TaxID=43982 RepID=A0ACB5SY88_AMBMO|nr:unnamed protein product [Ambrosiozyma monospora]